MAAVGRWLVLAGLALVIVGALVWGLAHVPGLSKLPLGRLPGDVRVERDGVHFYFPIVTCLVLSALLSLVLWIVQRLR
jgi:hypothetical protein